MSKLRIKHKSERPKFDDGDTFELVGCKCPLENYLN